MISYISITFSSKQIYGAILIYIYIYIYGGGMSVERRDHGGDLAIPESCQGYCRSRYDAEITRNQR